MQYMLLIYNAEGQKLNPEEQGKLFQEYMAFTQGIVKAGKFKAGDPLEPTSTATTVRVRNAKTLTTDGPFAETKEQLLGFYVVECATLDAAIETATKLARANSKGVGAYEIRPISIFRPGVGAA
jgi:hypothetical protein